MKGRIKKVTWSALLVGVLLLPPSVRGILDREAHDRAPTVEEVHEALVRNSAGSGWEVYALHPPYPEETQYTTNAWWHVFSPRFGHIGTSTFTREGAHLGEPEYIAVMLSGRENAVHAIIWADDLDDWKWMEAALPETKVLNRYQPPVYQPI